MNAAPVIGDPVSLRPGVGTWAIFVRGPGFLLYVTTQLVISDVTP